MAAADLVTMHRGNGGRRTVARSDSGETARGLPRDCDMLPLSKGGLLVSRDHAVFCRVPPEEVDGVRGVISGRPGLEELSPDLLAELDRHGFFGPPREAKPETRTVQLQLTNACNLACRYCCTNSGEARPAEVCHERLRQVVRQIPEVMGPRTGVALLGGEPLAVPWALDLAREIVTLGLDLTIFTNGMPLADPDLARHTADLTAKGVEVRVSLAGPSAPSCDALSGTCRFETAIAGLHRLAAFGGRAVVDLMLVPQHIDTIAHELPMLRKRLPTGTPIALGVLYASG